MRVFSDFHHAGLLNSLILLFEDRLGYDLYRPIGRDWHTQGYWKIYDHPATVAQYLDIGGATPDGSDPLNEVVSEHPADKIEQYGSMWTGTYKCHDISSESTNKAITYDAFMRGRFDVVIASIPQHIMPFRELCDRHPDHPILLYQIGNQWNITDEQAKAVDGILASALVDIPESIPHVIYHQEFNTDIFHPRMPRYDKIITSLVNVFTPENALFAEDYKLFSQVERLLPDYKFRINGGQGRDGVLHGDREVARAIEESLFVWHTKAGGDGYGHIIHNAIALGRPLIVKKEYYQGKMADRLISDGHTAIVIDGMSPEQIALKIVEHTEVEKYRRMVQEVSHWRDFPSMFSQEAFAIRNMLQNLLDTR